MGTYSSYYKFPYGFGNEEKLGENLLGTGFDPSRCIYNLCSKWVREKRIPFEAAIYLFYSEHNIARLRKSIAQIVSTGGTIHEVDVND